jgi:hypothetical protein
METVAVLGSWDLNRIEAGAKGAIREAIKANSLLLIGPAGGADQKIAQYLRSDRDYGYVHMYKMASSTLSVEFKHWEWKIHNLKHEPNVRFENKSEYFYLPYQTMIEKADRVILILRKGHERSLNSIRHSDMLVDTCKRLHKPVIEINIMNGAPKEYDKPYYLRTQSCRYRSVA